MPIACTDLDYWKSTTKSGLNFKLVRFRQSEIHPKNESVNKISLFVLHSIGNCYSGNY